MSYIAPLYLYPENREDTLFALEDDGSAWPLSAKGRRPNLNPDFVREMEAKLGLRFVPEPSAHPHPQPAASPEGESESPSPRSGEGFREGTFSPEDIFAYAYAVFHSPTYRQRYAEFLKIDFPRLPLTTDPDLFRTLVDYGAQLVDWHLLRHPDLAQLLTTFPASGSNIVERGYPKYSPPHRNSETPPPAPPQRIGEGSQRRGFDVDAIGHVYINPDQYFAGVPQAVWDFQVGGYQVLDKWLKDRRGRALSFEDIRHYQRIVVALQATLRLMDHIDAAIPVWPLP